MNPGSSFSTAADGPSHREFVVMMAASMALQAAAIDAMLPALGDIGRTFSVTRANDLQWIINSFIIGTGIGQLLWGPLSDRFGRRPVLLSGLTLYALFSLLAMWSSTLPMLLTMRAVQGMVGAVCSVVPRSIVRDRFHGSTMARVTSTIFIVFLLVPMVAPAFGQMLLFTMSWRGIFGVLATLALLVIVWMTLRLPETLPPRQRRPLSLPHLAQAAWFIVSEPSSILYTLAMTVMFGSLLAYVSTMPQIFVEGFHRPGLMALVFAGCAGAMGMASYFNTRIVERVGMHRVSHLALAGFVLITGMHAAVAAWMGEGVWGFALFQAVTLACFGLAVPNFGAIAMQPMGALAGSAASLQGLISNIGAAAVSSQIGRQWSGSVWFLPAGAFVCGAAAFAFVLLAERSRMFAGRVA